MSQHIILSTQQDYYDRQYSTQLHSYCTGTYTEVTTLLLVYHVGMLDTSPPCHFAPISKFANSKFIIIIGHAITLILNPQP